MIDSARLEANLGLYVDLYFCGISLCSGDSLPLEHSQLLEIWREILMTDTGRGTEHMIRKKHYLIVIRVEDQQLFLIDQHI